MGRFPIYYSLVVTAIMAFFVQSSGSIVCFVVFILGCFVTGMLAGGAFWYPLMEGWRDCSIKWRKFAEEEIARSDRLLAERDSGDWWKDKS